MTGWGVPHAEDVERAGREGAGRGAHGDTIRNEQQQQTRFHNQQVRVLLCCSTVMCRADVWLSLLLPAAGPCFVQVSRGGNSPTHSSAEANRRGLDARLTDEGSLTPQCQEVPSSRTKKPLLDVAACSCTHPTGWSQPPQSRGCMLTDLTPTATTALPAGTMKAFRSAVVPPTQPSRQHTARPSSTRCCSQQCSSREPTQRLQQPSRATTISHYTASARNGSCCCCGRCLRCPASLLSGSLAAHCAGRKCECRTRRMAVATSAASDAF